MKTKNLLLSIVILTAAFLPATRAEDLALRFDGVNDFVTFGQAPGLGVSNFTIEVWFMRQGVGITTNTGSGGFFAVPLVTKGRAEADNSNVDMNYFLGIATDNRLAADFETFVGGTNKPVFGTTTILSNVWYHAAVTYNGTNWALYLNNSLEANLNVGTGVYPRYDSLQHAGLAVAMNSTGQPAGAFAGLLDEVRIWNCARTQQEIKDTTRVAITNAQTGLLGRWGLDEIGGSIASNTAVPAVTGILSNGPTRVAGYPFALAGTGGLYFDGTNDFVTFGGTTSLGVSNFTIETWFKRTGTGLSGYTGTGGFDAIPLVTKGRGEVDASNNADMNYFFGIRTNDNVLFADFEQVAGSTNNPVHGVTPIVTGVWYHAAATYNGTNWSLYLNGVLETNVFSGQTPRFDSVQHAGLGTAMTTIGTPQGAFHGVLDEVRIWNYARTATEIANSKNYPILAASGLVARCGLDEEWGIIATNTGSTVVHGILSNGPTWVAGAPLATNNPPAIPILIAPANNASNVTTSPLLSANVSDPEGSNLVVTFYGRVAPTAGPDFTIAVLPDTQYYCANLNGGTSTMFSAQTDWIVSNRVSRNIAFVTHVGDCVENGDSFLSEWINATNAMYRLANPATTGLLDGIPYGIAVGNHDQSPQANPNGTTTYYNQFFGTNYFGARAYYGGHSGTNNDTHFELFSAGGLDFVILHLEYGATNAADLAWANSIMQTYSNRRAIYTSHHIIGTGNPASYAAQGQVRYDAFKTNANWFLAICGHVAGEGRRQDTFAGNTVNTLMADYQNRSNGGNGWMRLLEFSPVNNEIRVKTYSPVLNQFENDADSQFTLSYNMSSGATPFAVIGVSSNVPSSSMPTMAWPGLTTNTTYEWYVTVSDGFNTVSSSTNRFTTGSLPPPDSDGDGLLDSWELSYFGTLAFGAGDNPDGDGLTNLQELQAGTDPTNSASAFRITAISRLDGTNILVTWMTGSSKTNALERSVGTPNGSYSNNFVAIFAVTNTTGTTTNYLDLGAATNTPSRYYRVRLVP